MKLKIIAFMVFLISGEKILTHEESIQRHNNVLSGKFAILFYSPAILMLVTDVEVCHQHQYGVINIRVASTAL